MASLTIGRGHLLTLNINKGLDLMFATIEKIMMLAAFRPIVLNSLHEPL